MPRYRLKSGSSNLLVGGRRVKLSPGDVVDCPKETVRSFQDQFECLDPPEDEIPKVEASLEMKHRGGGWYDVVNPDTQEAINDKALKKEEAEDLVG